MDARDKRSDTRTVTKETTATNAAAPAKPPPNKVGDKSSPATSRQKKAASDKTGAGTTAEHLSSSEKSPWKKRTAPKKPPTKKTRHTKTTSAIHTHNCRFWFKTIIATALRKMGLDEACVHRVASIPTYETVMNKVVPFMNK
jgi:hypothetical protein